MSLALFPAPRELEETGERVPADVPVTRRTDARLPAEGFGVDVGSDGIVLSHADADGLRFAEAALAQIRAQSPDALPGLRLRDAPDLPVRGYMLDVSRDRVPTRETLERVVDLLSLCRLNQLQLYTEHTFAYRDHETVWSDASPITPDDVRWLDDLCRARGIELVANQNCFGHLARWLAHDRYRDRAEAPDGFELPGLGRREPAVLAPTEENARFAVELVRELMACFTSRRVNVGCDETFELGRGRSRALVEEHGRGRVYLDHLRRLLDALHGDGCEVLFWGDILRSHPELVRELPEQRTVALAWHYEAPMDPSGLPEAARSLMASLGIGTDTLRGFAGQVPPFAQAGLPFWVCPGTSSWNSLVGRWSNAKANLLDAVEASGAQGASGLLLTDWGDNGHHQPPSVSFAPMVFAGALAWGRDRHRDLDVAAVLDAHVFGDASGVLGSLHLEAAEAYAGTGRRAFNASPLFGELVKRSAITLGDVDVAATRLLADRLGEMRERATHAEPTAPDGALCVRELCQAIRLARHGAWRMLRGAGAAAPDDAALHADLAEAIEEQRACWRLRSREGGLADSIARLERTLASYEV